MSAEQVSVVIPARNATATIGLQLEALAHQSVPVDEVIVVDNASTDGLAELVRAFAAERSGPTRFRVVHCAERGVNHARNAGVRAALGSYILLCDADDVVDPAWAAELVNGLRSHRLVGGATVPFTTALSANQIEVLLRSGRRILPQVDERLWNLQSAIGCNLGFRRSLWEELGGFDVRIDGSLDENEFVFRARLRGVELALCPNAVVAYRRDSSRSKKLRRAYQEGRNRKMLQRLGVRAGLDTRPTLRRSGNRLPSSVNELLGDVARFAGALDATTEHWPLRRARRRPE